MQPIQFNQDYKRIQKFETDRYPVYVSKTKGVFSLYYNSSCSEQATESMIIQPEQMNFELIDELKDQLYEAQTNSDLNLSFWKHQNTTKTHFPHLLVSNLIFASDIHKHKLQWSTSITKNFALKKQTTTPLVSTILQFSTRVNSKNSCYDLR